MAAMWRASSQGRVVEVLGRDDAVDHADLVGALGADPVRTGEDDLLGDLGPDDPGQDHDDDPGPELQLRLAEEGVLGGNRDVAGERQLAGPGEAGRRARRRWSASGNARSA